MSQCCSNNSACEKSSPDKAADFACLKPGDSAKIVGYKSGSARYLDKLLSMGLVRNTVFTVVRVAPLGDPIDIKVRNYHLTLRKDEASILKLEPAHV
jgi:ferrous iron transport protein A